MIRPPTDACVHGSNPPAQRGGCDHGIVLHGPTVAHMTTEHSLPEKLSLERLPQVLARTGLSRAGLYRLIAAGHFPRPVRLTERSSAWPSAEVDEFIQDRMAARDSKAVQA